MIDALEEKWHCNMHQQYDHELLCPEQTLFVVSIYLALIQNDSG